MTSTEKEEIEKLPEKYQPIGAVHYFWLGILYVIPLIGWIFLIIHALSDSNINRRSYARSYFIPYIIAIVAGIIVIIISVITGKAILQ